MKRFRTWIKEKHDKHRALKILKSLKENTPTMREKKKLRESLYKSNKKEKRKIGTSNNFFRYS